MFIISNKRFVVTNCIFFSQTPNSELIALFKAEKAKGTPCLIKRFEGMSKDVEKSLDEQRLLEEKLKNVWLENLSQKFSISSRNKDLCNRKFSLFFSQAKIRVLGSKDKPILRRV